MYFWPVSMSSLGALYRYKKFRHYNLMTRV
jgi:hypothetical protein